AAATLVRAATRMRLALGMLAIATLVLPGVPALGATQNEISALWYEPIKDNGLQFPSGEWRPVWDQLNHEVRDHGSYQVAAPEEYGSTLWAFSGAQVVSLWLPGPYKLGYEPKPLTGFGYQERVRRQARGFGRGVPGLCGLVRPFGLNAFVLDRLAGDRIGTVDVWPAAQYRRDRIDRDASDLSRRVAPGLTYRDENLDDVLRLDRRAQYPTPCSPRAPDIAPLTLPNPSLHHAPPPRPGPGRDHPRRPHPDHPRAARLDEGRPLPGQGGPSARARPGSRGRLDRSPTRRGLRADRVARRPRRPLHRHAAPAVPLGLSLDVAARPLHEMVPAFPNGRRPPG